MSVLQRQRKVGQSQNKTKMKKTEINGCTVLEADAGKKIVKDNEFVCGTVVWLAVNDTEEDYTEITEKETEELEKVASPDPSEGGEDRLTEDNS